MKYSKNHPPLECIMTNSTCYKSTRVMNIKGILWHSTGANNPNLKRYVQPSTTDKNYKTLIQKIGKNTAKTDYNSTTQQSGLNAFIGKLADGTVTTVQTMPWNYRPWGCGSGSRGSCNTGWIQFEICEDNLANETYFNAVYKEACELTAYLCLIYNINPKATVKVGTTNIPTILCHADSYKLGYGSNHGDVLHWFKKYGKTMDNVRDDVELLLNNISTSIKVKYQAKTIASSLNVRSGPGTTFTKVYGYPQGTLITITAENNGWGQTDKGWVSLQYITKIEDTITEIPSTPQPTTPIVTTKEQQTFNNQMAVYLEELATKDPGSWSADARKWAENKGIIQGDIKGNMRYKSFITREELIVLLYRLFKEE